MFQLATLMYFIWIWFNAFRKLPNEDFPKKFNQIRDFEGEMSLLREQRSVTN